MLDRYKQTHRQTHKRTDGEGKRVREIENFRDRHTDETDKQNEREGGRWSIKGGMERLMDRLGKYCENVK